MFFIFMFFFISLPALCFEIGQPFLVINEKSSTAQAAFRSYVSSDGRVTVQLIAVAHKALPSFYESIQEMIAGKVVLYELADGSLEVLGALEKRIRDFGEAYERAYDLINKPKADALGQVLQGTSFYRRAKELIHADLPGGLPGFSPARLNDTELKQLLDKLANDADSNCSSRAKLSAYLREDIKIANKEISIIRSGGEPPSLLSLFGKRWREITLDRNKGIFNALATVWSQRPDLAELSIVYGASHLPFVEDFLLENGFRPVKGSDGWLVVAELEPSNK